MKNYIRIDKWLLPLSAAVFLVFLTASTAMAQFKSESDSPQMELVVKIDAISPMAGVSFQVQRTAKLRALLFFTSGFDDLAFGKRFYFDLSYLRYNNWLIAESTRTYWGAGLSLVSDNDEALGPGFLVGAVYELGEHISLFGEVGLTIYAVGDVGGAHFGLFNTGIGMKVAL